MLNDISFGLAFSTGFLSFFAPCVLPLLPAWLTLATGLSYKDLIKEGEGENSDIKIKSNFFSKRSFKVFWPTLFFVFGFSAVFVASGAAIGYLSDFLYEYQDFIRYVGGAFLIIFALYLLGLISPAFLNRERRFRIKDKPLGLLGSFLVGVTFAAAWSPCLGPTAGSIMFLAASQSGLSHGFWLLAVFSFGLALPFLIISFSWGGALHFLGRFQKFIPLAQKITGLLVLLIAFLMFLGYF